MLPAAVLDGCCRLIPQWMDVLPSGGDPSRGIDCTLPLAVAAQRPQDVMATTMRWSWAVAGAA